MRRKQQALNCACSRGRIHRDIGPYVYFPTFYACLTAHEMVTGPAVKAAHSEALQYIQIVTCAVFRADTGGKGRVHMCLYIRGANIGSVPCGHVATQSQVLGLVGIDGATALLKFDGTSCGMHVSQEATFCTLKWLTDKLCCLCFCSRTL